MTAPNVDLNLSGDHRRPEPRQPVARTRGKHATLSFMPIWSALLQRLSTLCNEVFERIRRGAWRVLHSVDEGYRKQVLQG